MSDCSKCSNRAELHPEFRKLPFDKTPCANCRGDDPAPIGLPFNDSLAAVFTDPSRESRFRDFIKRFSSLTARQRDVCWYIHNNPGLSGRAYAKAMQLDKRTFQRAIRLIMKTVPEFASNLPKPPDKPSRFSPMMMIG